MKPYFSEELNDTVKKINLLKTDNSLSFYLVTDSHFYSFSNPIATEPRCTFENLKALNDITEIDCAFHIGDLMWSTQRLRDIGYWSKEMTDSIMLRARDEYVAACKNCFFIGGNHDEIDAAEPIPKNYYDRMIAFQKEKLCDVSEGKMYYSVDFPKQRVKAICLMACYGDEMGCHYGYYREQVEWLEQVLLALPDGYKVLLFTHIDPIGLDRTHKMENEEEFMGVLEAFCNGEKFEGDTFKVDFTKKSDATISAMFTGHGHFDFVIAKKPFYIIERASNHLHQINPGDDWTQPENAVSPRRKVGTYTEDLFDTVIFDPIKNSLDIIRFGAGDDAHFDL